MGECRGQTYSDDGGDEFDEEFVKPQERRVEVIEVVNEQTLDMRTIVILEKISEPTRKIDQMVADLICHDHDTPIP